MMIILKRIKLIYLIKSKHFAQNLGSTLTENLAAMSILTVTLGAMFPAFMIEKEQNINQRILTGAVALSKETLDDLRRQKILNIPLGQSSSTKEKSGYSYALTQYVCTEQPTINTDESVSCSTTVLSDSNLRYILVNIEKNGKKIYTVETVFTKLR